MAAPTREVRVQLNVAGDVVAEHVAQALAAALPVRPKTSGTLPGRRIPTPADIFRGASAR